MLWATLSHYCSSFKEVRKESQAGQKPKSEELMQRPQRDAACLLACLPWLPQLPFLQTPGPPAQGWHSGLGLHHLLLIKKMPYSLLYSLSLMEAFSELWFPALKMI